MKRANRNTITKFDRKIEDRILEREVDGRVVDRVRVALLQRGDTFIVAYVSRREPLSGLLYVKNEGTARRVYNRCVLTESGVSTGRAAFSCSCG